MLHADSRDGSPARREPDVAGPTSPVWGALAGTDLPRWIAVAFWVLVLALPALAIATAETSYRAEGTLLFTRAPLGAAGAESIAPEGFDAIALAGHLSTESRVPGSRVDVLSDRFALVEVIGDDAAEVAAGLDRAVATAVSAPPPGTGVVPVRRTPTVDAGEDVRATVLLGVVLPFEDPDWLALPRSGHLGDVLGTIAESRPFAADVLAASGSVELRQQRWDDAPLMELSVVTDDEADALPTFSRTVERLRREVDRLQGAAAVPSGLRTDLVVMDPPVSPTTVADEMLSSVALMVLWAFAVLTWMARAIAISLRPLGEVRPHGTR